MASRRERVDKLLVDRGLVDTRTRAQALVMSGSVYSGERRIEKPGDRLDLDLPLAIRGEQLPYVSRGGLKLQAALDRFAVEVGGKIALDVGASTGGFTDCLLQRGALRVYAIDVGYGQLHEKLRRDPRVVSHERVNARALGPEEVPEQVDLAVMDVSFISLKLVLRPTIDRLKAGGTLVALVKPQFEVGKGEVGKGGVVRDPEARARAIEGITGFARDHLSLSIVGVMDSPIAGPAGNVEALLVAHKPS